LKILFIYFKEDFFVFTSHGLKPMASNVCSFLANHVWSSGKMPEIHHSTNYYYTNLVSKYAINKLEYIFLLEGKNYLHSRNGNNF